MKRKNGRVRFDFQAATGQTLREVIQQRQGAEARRLLVGTQLSITAIAENCGFCNSSSFARGFRALAGMSPVACRKRARLKKTPAK